MKRLISGISILILLGFVEAYAQSENKTITIVPEPDYKAGWLKEIFLGSHWRNVWTTPVKMQILDLDKYDGGLVPVKKGGGFQTLSLRLRGSSGKIWKFRSMNKNPEKLLPEALQNSIAADVIKDQISSANPYAPLLVKPILDSVGILHNPAYLYYMPDDPKLGEFREEFGGIPGMIELHPDEEDDKVLGYEGAVDEKGTLDLWDRLETKRSEAIDAGEFLKARLVDHFIGDWDRHTDQWKWIKYEEGEEEIWKPVPRDRDQAFSKFTGLLPSMAEFLMPQLNTFDYEYPNLADLSWNARYMDRRILPALSKAQWDSVTSVVYQKLTDPAIEDVADMMPPEVDRKYSEEIISKLQSRKTLFFEMSKNYYELINSIVDVFCSDERDYVEIFRLNDEQTEVVRYKRDKDTGEKIEKPFFHRVFDNSVTKEIRVYLGDDKDYAVVRGDVNDGPVIRVIGGEGKDELIDSSIVRGYWAYITPIPDAENKTLFYDYGNETEVTASAGTVYDDTKVSVPKNLEERYEPKLRDRRSDYIFYPLLDLNKDDGFVLGGVYDFSKFNFRAEPYDYRVQIFGEFASNPSTGSLELNAEFRSLIKDAAVNVDALVSGLRYTKFFGIGNETSFDDKLDDQNFYRLKEEYYQFRTSIETEISRKFIIGAGINYEHSDSELVNPVLLQQNPDAIYGFGNFALASFRTFVKVDTRDNASLPYTGFYLNLNGEVYPELLDNGESFARGEVDIRAYISQQTFTHLRYSGRIYGGRVWGNYPFMKGIKIGGSENLRGYSRDRFLGDSVLPQSNRELQT